MRPFDVDEAFEADGAKAAHEAVQESYEVGGANASFQGVFDIDSFEEEADHGISRMMGEGGVAPPESPEQWNRWAQHRQPQEGDRHGKM